MRDPVQVAARAWRRLGVSSELAAVMARDLRADLNDAAAAGRGPDSFTGGDPAGMARAWAAARGLIRPRPRLLRVVVAAVGGALPGAAVALLLVVAPSSLAVNDLLLRGTGRSTVVPASTGRAVSFDWALDPPLWLVVIAYLVSAAIAAVGSVAAVSAVLAAVGDPARTRTVRAWSAALPLVALLGLLAGAGAAALRDFQTRPGVAVDVGLAVLVLVTLSAAATRVHALRQQQRPVPSTEDRHA